MGDFPTDSFYTHTQCQQKQTKMAGNYNVHLSQWWMQRERSVGGREESQRDTDKETHPEETEELDFSTMLTIDWAPHCAHRLSLNTLPALLPFRHSRHQISYLFHLPVRNMSALKVRYVHGTALELGLASNYASFGTCWTGMEAFSSSSCSRGWGWASTGRQRGHQHASSVTSYLVLQVKPNWPHLRW